MSFTVTAKMIGCITHKKELHALEGELFGMVHEDKGTVEIFPVHGMLLVQVRSHEVLSRVYSTLEHHKQCVGKPLVESDTDPIQDVDMEQELEAQSSAQL